jgi:predicted naringenin-chalcone synthase
VDLWVALINPVARVQHESAFRKIPDWFGPEITLDPRSSNFPCCETGVESTGFVRIPRKSRFYIDPGDIHTVLFSLPWNCELSFRRDDWSNSHMVATALFGDGARSRC